LAANNEYIVIFPTSMTKATTG